MCAKFGCGPTVVSKKKGVQTDRQRKLQLYIVDINLVHIFCVKMSLNVTLTAINKMTLKLDSRNENDNTES